MDAVACLPVVPAGIERGRIEGYAFSPLDFSGKYADSGFVVESVGTYELHHEIAVEFQDVSENSTRVDGWQLVRVAQNEQLEVSAGRERLQECGEQRDVYHARFVDDVDGFFGQRVARIERESALLGAVFQEPV